MLCMSMGWGIHAHALSQQQQIAQQTVRQYYQSLQEYARFPNDLLVERLKGMFAQEGNIVYNDLYEIENEYGTGLIEENQEAQIDQYILCITNLWSTADIQLQIRGEIDPSTYIEENDPDAKESNITAVWVTATKYMSFAGHAINGAKGSRETFKIKNGKIQSIRSPEKSTAIIDALRSYNRGDYKNAYYAFIKQINDGTADDDTYFYLGLMFRKGKAICKELYPSKDLRDKLCAFYWMKSYRGREAAHYFGIRTYYHLDYKSIKSPFRCGLMTVYKGNGESYGYMDERGKMPIPYQFKRAYSFSEKERLAIVETQRGEWGLIRTDGSYAVQPMYGDIQHFAEGIYAMQRGSQWGLMGTDGRVILAPCHDGIRAASEGLAAFKDNDLWGFMDEGGTVRIAPQYGSVQDFSDGLAAVAKNGTYGLAYGFVDKEGRIAIPCIFQAVTPFAPRMDIAAVKVGDKWGLIDRQGNILLDFLYQSITLDEAKGHIRARRPGEATEDILLKDLRQAPIRKRLLPINN